MFTASPVQSQEIGKDFPYTLGTQWGEMGIDPVNVLSVVAAIRQILPYEGDVFPAQDDAGRLWAGYRRAKLQPAGHHLVVSGTMHGYNIASGLTPDTGNWAELNRFHILQGTDLRGLDLYGVDWNYIDLRGVNFDNSSVEGDFSFCWLQESTWNSTNMHHTVFTQCDMEDAGVNWEVQYGRTVNIIHTSLRNSTRWESMLLGQQYGENSPYDNSSLNLRFCDLNGVAVPEFVADRATIRDCTGYVPFSNSCDTVRQELEKLRSNIIEAQGAFIITSGNSILEDGNEHKPTGAPGSSSVRIGHFYVLRSPALTGWASVNCVLLANNPGFPLHNNFRHIKLFHQGKQVGITHLTSPTSDQYYFEFPTIPLTATQELLAFEVYADIRSDAMDIGNQTPPVALVKYVGGTNEADGQIRTYGHLPLQRAFIMKQQLKISFETILPSPALAFGQEDILLALIVLEANAVDNITITELPVVDRTLQANLNSVEKILVLDEHNVVASQRYNFSLVSYDDGIAGIALIKGLNITIPRGSQKRIMIMGNTRSWDQVGLTQSGVTHQLGLTANYTSRLKAFGTNSGQIVGSEAITVGEGGESFTAPLTLYRGIPRLYWSRQSPYGPAVSGDDQIIAQIEVGNLENAADADITIESLRLQLQATFALTGRGLKVYRENISAQTLLHANAIEDGNIALTDEEFVDVIIASGRHTTLIVTLDTADVAPDNTLTISNPGILWNDGSSTHIKEHESATSTPQILEY